MVSIEIKDSQKINGEKSAFISFPYDTELVTLMRSITNRFWHPDKKVWEVPAEKLGYILNKIPNHEITITGLYSPVTQEEEVTLDGVEFKTKPFNHQIAGVKFGLKNDKFLLGDEQGLGKTKQVIDIAVAKKNQKGYKHCLIICGVNGLKWNWYNEVLTHSNEKPYILGTRLKGRKSVIGSTKDRLDDLKNIKLLGEYYFLITNIEILRNKEICDEVKKLCDKGIIDMVAVDEIHKCKNPTSQQGKALLKLDGATTKIAMTGTPIMNTPLDTFVPLKWLGQEKHSFYQFKNHYCVMGGYGGYEVVGYKNLGELQNRIDKIMLRRLKKDVLDLPEKIYTTEYVEMSKEQQKIYNEVREELKENIDKIMISPNPLAQLIRLRQATGYTGILSSTIKQSAKLDRLEELVEEIVDNGGKAIVFSNWTDMTGPTFERLRHFNPAIITGETVDRVAEQDKFMNDPSCKVIIGTIGAMGTGLTLTAANTVIFLDEPWNRANKEQAEDRAHRIGTTSNVNIITLICKDTIDERINQIVNEKGEMADILIDGKVTGNKGQLIDFLLN